LLPKFRTEQDETLFLLEVGEKDTPTFLKSRKSLVKKLVNFRKSQRSKQAWQGNRFKYMKGIRKFHRSIQGKRFHRQLSRFMLTRLGRNEQAPENRAAALTAISSLRTHLYLEKQYYSSVNEQADFDVLYEYAVPMLIRAEKKLFSYKDLDEDELELMLRLINPREFAKELDDTSILEQWNWDRLPEATYGLTKIVTKFLNGEMK